MTKRRALHDLPLRTCQTMHRCCVCLENISYGDRYRDGDALRRAHVRCAEDAGNGSGRRELTRDEIRSIQAAETVVSKAKGVVYQAERELDKLRVGLGLETVKGGGS